ncbi:hypothetical protein [Fluviicola sp.]|uniref:hypothetical protein n=1 Tax=Fluviicola sp. TaxID=1917219 RepID=UPI00282FE948|nr:hypothetical protein [Fluviicola sp.]MDR0801653.1 hypothetical protein [Fluviicola sp.]
MKKLMFTGAILAAVGVSVFSCTKETVKPAAENVQENNAEHVVTKMNGGDLRVFSMSPDGKDAKCDGSNGNCLPDVVIRPSRLQKIVTDLTDNGLSGNDDIVREIIRGHFDELRTVISENLLTDYLNNKLTLSMKENSSTKSVFLIFSSKGEIVNVQPFIFE